MHHLELRYLTELMSAQIETQREIMERAAAIWDQDMTLDEALTARKIIESDEEYLDHITTILLNTADQGFLDYNHAGGLTTFFYGYTSAPPAHTPGHYPRKSR